MPRLTATERAQLAQEYVQWRERGVDEWNPDKYLEVRTMMVKKIYPELSKILLNSEYIFTQSDVSLH